MGYNFFPGDNSELKVAILKSSENIKPCTLAMLRFGLAVFFVIHTAFHVYVVWDEFWQYLTNWSFASCVITYILLTAAHYINGDFCKCDCKKGKAYYEGGAFDKQP